MRTTATKKAKQRKFSLSNPPDTFTVGAREVAELEHSSRNVAYRNIAAGRYPYIQHGRNIRVLTAPLLAILKGERPPGPLPGETPPKKKRGRPTRNLMARKKKRAKSVVKKSEAVPAAPVP
jgi:hypothetical protein